MKTLHNNYCNSKQGYLPLFLSDCLDLLDPVLTFDRLMGGIDLNKYLTDIPEYTTGRLRYNPVNMLKTVLFGFMTSGHCSLRELEDNCKVNIRFMYLIDHQTPSYRTFGYFINEILQDKIIIGHHNKTFFIALCVRDENFPGVQIDVLRQKFTTFVRAQTAGINQPKQHWGNFIQKRLAICTPHCVADDDIHVLNLIFDTNTHDFCHSSRFFLMRSRHSSNRVISSSEKPL